MRYGILLGVAVGLIGCGAVDAKNSDAATDGVAAGTGGAEAGAAGGSGGEALSAGGRSGNAGVEAGAGSGGAPDPGRPLGAGCTTNAQCGSHICDDATQACCDKRPSDTCGACIGGYFTPKPDGTSCGALSCGGPRVMVPGEPTPSPTVATVRACQAGACVEQMIDCEKPFTCSDGKTYDFGAAGLCDEVDGCARVSPSYENCLRPAAQ